jgi:hypothetical protein
MPLTCELTCEKLFISVSNRDSDTCNDTESLPICCWIDRSCSSDWSEKVEITDWLWCSIWALRSITMRDTISNQYHTTHRSTCSILRSSASVPILARSWSFSWSSIQTTLLSCSPCSTSCCSVSSCRCVRYVCSSNALCARSRFVRASSSCFCVLAKPS